MSLWVRRSAVSDRLCVLGTYQKEWQVNDAGVCVVSPDV
jgi:hypothetical protein